MTGNNNIGISLLMLFDKIGIGLGGIHKAVDLAHAAMDYLGFSPCHRKADTPRQGRKPLTMRRRHPIVSKAKPLYREQVALAAIAKTTAAVLGAGRKGLFAITH